MRRALVRTVALTTLALAVVGCGHGGSERGAGTTVPTYVDGTGRQGVLSASSGRGGFDAAPATHAPWQSSFGQFFLCVTRPGASVTILGVAPIVRPGLAPQRVAVWMRTTTRAAVAATPPQRRTDYAGVSSIGAPPRWTDPERTFFGRGSWSRRVAGTRVEATCPQYLHQQDAVNAGKVPVLATAHELVLTLTLGARGGALNGFTITYETDGQRARLRVPWEMTACGSAPRLHHLCHEWLPPTTPR